MRVEIGKFLLPSTSKSHPQIMAEIYELSAALLLSEYGGSPYKMNIDCSQNAYSKYGENVLAMNIVFDKENYDLVRFERTPQRPRITEDAAIYISFSFFPTIVEGRITRVTKKGEKLDYQINHGEFLLEVSGTESTKQFKKRYREKVKAGKENRRKINYFVVVCCFSTKETIFSFHEVRS